MPDPVSLPDQIVLRRATAADVEAIRTLIRAAYARWVPVLGREPAPMVADHERAVRINRIDLADAAGEPVGLIEMAFEADCLLIESVAVAPTWQRRGLGRALLAHAQTVAAAAGRRTTRLYTNARMTENIRLYEAAGYRSDGEVSSSFGVRVPMSKPVR